MFPEIAAKLRDYPLRTPPVIFRNLGNGKFEELFGIDAPHCSRGCAFGDFDNDGDIDILIVNLNEPPSLSRNDVTGPNHWLKVKLTGTKSNRSAIGARVTARYGGRAQTQEVLSQSSFYSSSDRRLHFGLGSAESVDLEVRWPAGGQQRLSKVTTKQILTIREP